MDTELDNIDAIFLDLDGTIYLGDNLISGSIDFLKRCDERGIKRFFLSNNSSKSVDEYLAKLLKLGIPATNDDILLSTHDLISWLTENKITKTWAIATKGMCQMMSDVGIDTKADNPEFVVLGYDTEINYEKIAKGSVFLHQGVPLVASHPDMVCPSPNGGLPDVGAYLAMLKATTNVDPVHICGKPNPGMILHKIEALGLNPARCAMVGDRLYTDIEMAARAGCFSILVLSGEATREDVERGIGSLPNLIVGSVDELLR
ncbi:MAG: HAD-IIA family hydrolase [Candidatus Poseidoniaceae archaeon]|jgi:HAD superfamily hydrolase (TIGR01450 family)|nr:HAD-IIA family hydrolase [Candidatus Poseidoniaceae archaeon]